MNEDSLLTLGHTTMELESGGTLVSGMPVGSGAFVKLHVLKVVREGGDRLVWSLFS